MPLRFQVEDQLLDANVDQFIDEIVVVGCHQMHVEPELGELAQAPDCLQTEWQAGAEMTVDDVHVQDIDPRRLASPHLGFEVAEIEADQRGGNDAGLAPGKGHWTPSFSMRERISVHVGNAAIAPLRRTQREPAAAP